MYPDQSLTHRASGLRTVPGSRPYPVLGMLPYMRKGPHEFFLRTALENGGVAQLGRPDRLLITHPEGIKHILLDNHQNYIKGKYAERLRLLIGNGLPVSDGEFWLRQRRLMQPAFHRQRLSGLATVITDTIASMLQRWQSAALSDQPLDIAMEMRRLAQESIVKTMFGVDIDIDQADIVGHAFTAVTEYIGYRSSAMFPLPEHWRTPRNHRFQLAQQRIDQAVYNIINKRRQSGTDTADIISMLLAARDEATGEGMSDEQVRDEVRTIFFAGYETTSSALAWIWYLLAQNPTVERRLYNEVTGVLGDRRPGFQDMPNLVYTRMVIEEAMRLYPPGWMTWRTVIADDQLDGYHIPAGAKIVISPYVTHRLPSLWEQPEAFDPERFTPEHAAQRHRYAYIPFGAGPRLCIGSNLALMEMQLTIAMVSQFYGVRLMPGPAVRPHPSITFQPSRGMRMQLHPR
jgi:cytochrome P450